MSIPEIRHPLDPPPDATGPEPEPTWLDSLLCATCNGSGRVRDCELSLECKDCWGTGRCPVEQPVYELDDEYELDETTGQFRHIPGYRRGA